MVIRFASFLLFALITSPVMAQSDGTVADLVARIQRIEAQNRTLTGEVEQLTNLLRHSQEDFKRYREDTDFRLQALEGKGGKPPAGPPPRRSDNTGDTPATPPPGPTAQPPRAPAGPGAPPRTLDQLAAEAAGDTQADLEASGDPTVEEGGIAGPPGLVGSPPARSSLTPPGLPGVAVATPPSGTRPPQATEQPDTPPGSASLSQTPEEEYTADYRMLEAKNYETAEGAFRQFLVSYPKDKRVPDATHWLGEALFQRQQYRDAAEQFLKVTKDYQNSRRAPSSMLRLGTSLAALGEKDAACATFKELTRRYPDAGPTVKTGTDKEIKRNGC